MHFRALHAQYHFTLGLTSAEGQKLKCLNELQITFCDIGSVSLGCKEMPQLSWHQKVKMFVRAKLRVLLSQCSVFQGHENSCFSCTSAN
jgi:hypothetical protein